MKEKPTTKLLKAARAELAKPYRWTKGGYVGPPVKRNGEVVQGLCAVGALRFALTGTLPKDFDIPRAPGYRRAFDLLNRVARSIDSEKYSHIAFFNDDPKTRKKDILAVFDRAIELSMKP